LGPDLRLLNGKDADADGLINRFNQRLRREVPSIAPFLRIFPEPVGDEEVLRINVPPGDKEVFRDERFYLRINNSTSELKGQSALDYIRSHFGRD
jgi:hypothetical protein